MIILIGVHLLFIWRRVLKKLIARKILELVELHNQINAEYRFEDKWSFKEQSSLPPSRKKAKSRKKL